MNTLRLGSSGPDVAAWQSAIGIVPPDGIFGPVTASATRTWQRAHGLVDDGVVGLLSWAAIGIRDTSPRHTQRGCDLSAVQGVLPDAVWKALAELGIKFVFLRAVVGNEKWPDGAAKENARRARAYGLLVAPYCFLYPLPHLNPLEQAEHFVRTLEGLGLMPDELPPMGDAEWPPREEWSTVGGVKTLTYPWKRWGCSAPQIRDFLVKCFARCDELTGIEWLLYSFTYWIDNCVEAWREPELTKRRLVLANYTYAGCWPTDEEVGRIKKARGFEQMPFIQIDGDGGLKLPNGQDADFDVFCGGEEELRALAAMRGFGNVVEMPTEANLIDVDLARQQMRGAILDAEIARYRRERIDVVT